MILGNKGKARRDHALWCMDSKIRIRHKQAPGGYMCSSRDLRRGGPGRARFIQSEEPGIADYRLKDRGVDSVCRSRSDIAASHICIGRDISYIIVYSSQNLR